CFLGRGDNLLATREIGEPLHDGKPGTNSVWLSWRPLASGIVTFDTRGSSFDNLLAIYNGESLTNLTLVAADDDSGGYYNAKLSFFANSGTTYRIAIDGL